VAEVPLRIPGAASPGQVQVLVFGGNWSEADPGNGVPEDGEVSCAGGTVSAFSVKGA
jgi:hypothetical protein